MLTAQRMIYRIHSGQPVMDSVPKRRARPTVACEHRLQSPGGRVLADRSWGDTLADEGLRPWTASGGYHDIGMTLPDHSLEMKYFQAVLCTAERTQITVFAGLLRSTSLASL